MSDLINLDNRTDDKIIKIKFFASWETDDKILNNILNQYDWNDDENYNKKYKFTLKNDFTHVIILSMAFPNINHISKKNIIGLAQEPAVHHNLHYNYNFINYCKNLSKYFIGSTKYYSKLPFIEKWSFQMPLMSYKHANKYIKNYPSKHKLINYVYSDKKTNYSTHLYVYRHLLGESLLKKNMNVDIYGGCTTDLKLKYGNDNKNIKYKFKWEDVNTIYENYKFTIVIENTIEPEYFSEKIIIPLLCGCTPIYLGCSNINNYFKDYVIHLTGNIISDLKIIENVMINPDKYYKKINIQEIKQKIHLKNLINDYFIIPQNIFDIVIPVGPNDKSIIEQQIKYTKTNIIGYRNIYLICYDPTICIDDCITINENIFPFNLQTVVKHHGKLDRNGWYLQQLLKLYAGKVIPGILDKYLVIDSDTFFLKPTTFVEDNKCLYNYGTEYHLPYFHHMTNLDNDFVKIDKYKSGICHHMIFETNYINELFNRIEKNHNDYFYNVFLNLITETQASGASEYEIYFNYMLKYNPNKIKIRKLNWKNGNSIETNSNLDYISVHYYMRK